MLHHIEKAVKCSHHNFDQFLDFSFSGLFLLYSYSTFNFYRTKKNKLYEKATLLSYQNL